MQSCIVLMGIKHCGKSTQANLLARHFSVPAFDTDDLILEMTGKTPRQIYTELGQEGFKKAEKEACLEFKKRLEKLSVTDTDGSRADNEKKYLAVVLNEEHQHRRTGQVGDAPCGTGGNTLLA